MATVAMQGGSGGLTKGHVRVIAASSIGTMFEWYDFYLYGSLAAIIAKQFFSALNPTSGYIVALMAFAAGYATCLYWPQAKPMVVAEVQKVEDEIKG